MAESKTGLSDLMEDLDLEDVNDAGYEQDVEVEIIDGFYHQNVAFKNDKVRLFAAYWMKLSVQIVAYSESMLLNYSMMEKLRKLKPFFKIGQVHLGHPIYHNYCWRLPMNQNERNVQRLRLNVMLFHLSRKWRTIISEGIEDEDLIKQCENSFKTIDNYVIQNAFVYGMWLCRAFDRFQKEKRVNRVSGSFDDWVNSRCKVKQTRARQLGKFYKLFCPYKKVLRCQLPFFMVCKEW